MSFKVEKCIGLSGFKVQNCIPHILKKYGGIRVWPKSTKHLTINK